MCRRAECRAGESETDGLGNSVKMRGSLKVCDSNGSLFEQQSNGEETEGEVAGTWCCGRDRKEDR